MSLKIPTYRSLSHVAREYCDCPECGKRNTLTDTLAERFYCRECKMVGELSVDLPISCSNPLKSLRWTIIRPMKRPRYRKATAEWWLAP